MSLLEKEDCLRIETPRGVAGARTSRTATTTFGSPDLDEDFAAWEDQFQTIRIDESVDGSTTCCCATAELKLPDEEARGDDHSSSSSLRTTLPRVRFVDPLSTMEVVTSTMKSTAPLAPVVKSNPKVGVASQAINPNNDPSASPLGTATTAATFAGSMYPPSESDSEGDDSSERNSNEGGHTYGAVSSARAFLQPPGKTVVVSPSQNRGVVPGGLLLDPEDQDAFDEFTNIALVEPTEEAMYDAAVEGHDQQYSTGGVSSLYATTTTTSIPPIIGAAAAKKNNATTTTSSSSFGRTETTHAKAAAIEKLCDRVEPCAEEGVGEAVPVDLSLDHLMSCDASTLQKVSASLAAARGMQEVSSRGTTSPAASISQPHATNSSSATTTTTTTTSSPTAGEAAARSSATHSSGATPEIGLSQDRRENRDRIKQMTQEERDGYMAGHMKKEEHAMLLQQAGNLAAAPGGSRGSSSSFEAAPCPLPSQVYPPGEQLLPDTPQTLPLSIKEQLQSIPRNAMFERWLDGGGRKSQDDEGEGEGAEGSRRLDFEAAMAETLAKYQ